MISVALIGVDGAGKTTIADMLQKSFPRPLKYLYMGINQESSNVGLPTTRFIESVKTHKRKSSGASSVPGASLHSQEAILKKKGFVKSVWLYVRLINRIAEEWYRQLLSWRYRKQGFIVLFDRHFLFDFDKASIQIPGLPVAEKIHRWCLHLFYPEPDLVIFLDAPPEVLFARKGEANIAYLAERRRAYLAQGEITRNFKCVDVTQPVEKVFADVCGHIYKVLGQEYLPQTGANRQNASDAGNGFIHAPLKQNDSTFKK